MAVVTVTGDNFDSAVLNSDKPVLVDFWASWCGPCRMVSPIVDEIGNESDGRYKVGKVNVDEEPDLAARFNVMSIPTLMVFKNGEPAKTSVGVKSKQDILEMLD
jgi:thioredoxin 1